MKAEDPLTDGAPHGAEAEFAHLRTAPGFTCTAEWTAAGVPFFLGVRDHVFSVYRGTGAVVHFDIEGRLRRAYLEDDRGPFDFLRGLDGRTIRKRKVRPGAQAAGEPPLDGAGRRALFDRVHGIAAEALAGFPGPADPAGDLLRRAAAWDSGRLEAEAARFLEAYRPLGIMPPDRYRSLILQATEGCAYNGCIFCSLYEGERHGVKTPEAFRDHVRRVKGFLGRALALRSGVFLGEANALTAPQAVLKEFIRIVREELPAAVIDGGPTGGGEAGISSFIDAFTRQDKGAREFAELKDLGLRRVFLGVESGDAGILEFLRKPASEEGVRALVGALKEAGISVGAILLVGAGGRASADRHVEGSAALIRSLPLDSGDLVYLSPLAIDTGGRYEREAARRGIEPLGPSELEAQEARLRRLLRPAPGRKGPLVARYDLRSFVYY